jgi:hypothetical protein
MDAVERLGRRTQTQLEGDRHTFFFARARYIVCPQHDIVCNQTCEIKRVSQRDLNIRYLMTVQVRQERAETKSRAVVDSRMSDS